MHKDTFGDLPDANIDHISFEAEPCRQNRDEYPGIDAAEDDLEDAVHGNESCDIIASPSASSFHTRTIAIHREANENQPAHVCGLTAKKEDGQEEHQHRPNDPVLQDRYSKNTTVTEDLAQPFVAYSCQRGIHHDDETDSDRNVRRPGLKAVHESSRAKNEMPKTNANCHREKNPWSEKTIEEGQLCAPRFSSSEGAREALQRNSLRFQR
jgi:hypothetical protein